MVSSWSTNLRRLGRAWKSLEEPGKAQQQAPSQWPHQRADECETEMTIGARVSILPSLPFRNSSGSGEVKRIEEGAPRLLDFTSRAYLAYLADFVVAAARPHWMAALAGSRHLEVWLSHSACHRSRMVAQSSVAPSAASSWSWVRRAAKSPRERQWRRLHSLAGQSELVLVQCYGAPRAR